MLTLVSKDAEQLRAAGVPISAAHQGLDALEQAVARSPRVRRRGRLQRRRAQERGWVEEAIRYGSGALGRRRRMASATPAVEPFRRERFINRELMRRLRSYQQITQPPRS